MYGRKNVQKAEKIAIEILRDGSFAHYQHDSPICPTDLALLKDRLYATLSNSDAKS